MYLISNWDLGLFCIVAGRAYDAICGDLGEVKSLHLDEVGLFDL